MRSRDAIWAAWAPPDVVWSRWVKPVLFAHMPPAPPGDTTRIEPASAAWAPPAQDNVVLVLDLPGARGVETVLGLAAIGYRPVLLHNIIPAPLLPDGLRASAAVDVAPTIAALARGADLLDTTALSVQSPPAFLLDSRRRGNRSFRDAPPSLFENRSTCFPSDFPSVAFLHEHGITGALVVQRDTIEPSRDLREVLRGWNEGGLPIDALRLDRPGTRMTCPIEPGWIARWLERLGRALRFESPSGLLPPSAG